MAAQIRLAFDVQASHTCPTQYLKNKGTSIKSFFQISGLREISPRHVNRRGKCCQQSTDNRRLLITLSVQLCIPCDGRLGVTHRVARVRQR